MNQYYSVNNSKYEVTHYSIGENHEYRMWLLDVRNDDVSENEYNYTRHPPFPKNRLTI